MKLTNEHGYPEPFVRAVTRDSYEKGDCDYTVTELIQPPRIRQLTERHEAEITEDVSERFWMILGTVAHDILERAGKEGQELTEERLYATVGGKRIGGKPDTLNLSSGLLTDYKVTSVWSYVLGNKPEWTAQLNSYAFLAQANGHEVKGLEIFAMFRDWSPSKAAFVKTSAGPVEASKGDYPSTNCLRIPIPLWPKDQTQIWLAGRVLAHENARILEDELLPVCTPEERWDRPTTYAVMRPCRKSALSVHESEAEAVKAMAIGQTVETRPGKSVRCESYCACASFCSYAKSLKPEAV
jgi:hypothetical protein